MGSKYTWTNGQMGQDRILCMLDRMLVNKAWADKFSNWRYKVLARTSSDHGLLMGWNIGIPKPHNSPFRYCKMWSSYPDFFNFVKSNWEIRLHGDPLFRLAKKLKRLKIGLKEWNTQIFEKFAFSPTILEEQMMNVIDKVINDEDNKMLSLTPTCEEVKMAVFTLTPSSSPGPDEFSGYFFQDCWTIIDKDVLQVSSPSLRNLLATADKSSAYIKDLWIGTVWGGSFILRSSRNNVFFDDAMITMPKIKKDLLSHIRDTTHLSQSHMKNCVGDLSVLHNLQAVLHSKKIQHIKSCYWKLPRVGEVKINSDDSSRGNPRKGGVGFIIRDHNGTVLRAHSKGLGDVTCYMAECSTLLQGLQDAASNRWLIAWPESDSTAAVKVFNNDNVPWQLKGDWEMVKTKIQQIRITSTWREVNFSSDQLANRGARLLEGNKESYVKLYAVKVHQRALTKTNEKLMFDLTKTCKALENFAELNMKMVLKLTESKYLWMKVDSWNAKGNFNDLVEQLRKKGLVVKSSTEWVKKLEANLVHVRAVMIDRIRSELQGIRRVGSDTMAIRQLILLFYLVLAWPRIRLVLEGFVDLLNVCLVLSLWVGFDVAFEYSTGA
ncbi:hypothetical protein GIB67_011557 [Kingdonia uniflora]|uniref:RNase H type-1 domain-containing protein n=1 Tax=Kingdonia uniflora TaxID=39325 RepID=A0A7J7NMJ4_9MAGN|nr:hypothetical protein GIB67_011557 [Kingdonia uniflora]